MKKYNILFALLFVFCVTILGGGCGSSHSDNPIAANNSDQFVAAVGDVADDLQKIANDAFNDRKVVNAIEAIVRQYLITDPNDATIMNRAIGKTFSASDIKVVDLQDNPSFDKIVYVKTWANRHITAKDGVVAASDFQVGTVDFQLTVISGDHTTKLTVTPNSTTGYWQAFIASTQLLNKLFDKQLQAFDGADHNYLVLIYSYSDATIDVKYDDETLLKGTIKISYPGVTGVTPDTTGAPVYAQTPHTAKFDLTLYPQASGKDYNVKIELERNTTSTGTNAISNVSNLKMYRTTGSNILTMNAGTDLTATAASSTPTAASLKALDLNIADKIRLAQNSPLNLVNLMTYYVTRADSDITPEEVESDAAEINKLLSNAGLAVYLNKSSEKNADVRATAGKIGGYNHVRFGLQFVGSDEVELVRDIANQEDLQKIRTLAGSVAPMIQQLADLLTNNGIITNVTSNGIIKTIFEDLFGSSN
ncbi:MAG: hypothetical protein IJ859_06380 [Synergistaceae bacterium]|nr:hypothetical protein [Synergistaceae bacterium]